MRLDFGAMGEDLIKSMSEPVEDNEEKQEKPSKKKKSENPVKKERATKPKAETPEPVDIKDDEEVVFERDYTPIFDLSDPRVRRIRRRLKSKKGEGKPNKVTSFAPSDEELFIMDQLCEKYYMCYSELIRTLIMNAR